jgi:hypothetical protein
VHSVALRKTKRPETVIRTVSGQVLNVHRRNDATLRHVCSQYWRRQKSFASGCRWGCVAVSSRPCVEGDDGKRSLVIRINEPHPDGRESLGQAEIACWPHSGSGIELGRLGA